MQKELISKILEDTKLSKKQLEEYLGVKSINLLSTTIRERLCDLLVCTEDDLADYSNKTFSRIENAETLTKEDLNGISAIGRIVKNIKEMNMII